MPQPTDRFGRMDRRSFLAVAAGAGLGGLGLAACARTESVREVADSMQASGGSLDRIGVQLYTVRDRMARGVPTTLQAVAELGYREVETAGFFDLSPEQFRAELDRAGLASPAGHYGVDALRQDLAGTLSAARTLGQEWVVVPWLAESERTAAGYRQLADELNRYGAAAREHGLRVAYHNHEFEFEPVEGETTGYDILLSGTDPERVEMELDLFWSFVAGRDPLTLFASHPGRFPLWHVKDMEDMQASRRMTSVGDGEIDFGRIFAQREQAGLRHFFVEHDNPGDSLDSIRRGYEHLRQLSF